MISELKAGHHDDIQKNVSYTITDKLDMIAEKEHQEWVSAERAKSQEEVNRLLAEERDHAEARRRRAVDQWNCVRGHGRHLKEVK